MEGRGQGGWGSGVAAALIDMANDCETRPERPNSPFSPTSGEQNKRKEENEKEMKAANVEMRAHGN